MTLVKPVLAAATALAALLMTFHAPAEAHGRWRGGVTLHFGAPWPGYWYPRYYAPPPVYYYPAPVYPAPVYPAYPAYAPVDRAPTYIERDDATADNDAAGSWYWCADAKKYYPYVKDCPGGWRRVPAQPTQ